MFNFFKKTLTEEQMKQMDKTIEKFKKNPHQFRFTVMFFLSSIVFGLLSILLLQQKFSLLMREGEGEEPEIREVVKKIFVTPSPKISITPTPEATAGANLIENNSWILDKSENCNVLVPVSPYKASYEDNNISRTWEFISLTTENDFPIPFLNIFNKIDIVRFIDNNNKTELIAGMTSIYCADNPDEISVITLKEKIATELEKDEELKETTIEATETVLWGKLSLKIAFSGGNLDGRTYYATTTDKHLYLISHQADLDDETVKRDTLNIFNGLIFLD